MNEPILLKVGKALDNDIVLNIPFISEYHLELFKDIEGNVFMTDLNSANGTFVNGKRLVGFVMLREKDEVFLGSGFRLQWEHILRDPKFSKDPNVINKIVPRSEPKKYVDAYETVSSQSQVKDEVENKVVDPAKENRDLAIIYGAIALIVIFWYIYS